MINLIKRIIKQEKRKAKQKIEESARQYDLTLDEDKGTELRKRCEDYEKKFRKEYKR